MPSFETSDQQDRAPNSEERQLSTSEQGGQLQEAAESKDLTIPWIQVAQEKVSRLIDDNLEISADKREMLKQALSIALAECNRQAIENFSVVQSTAFPGVEFSQTNITITPELISRLREIIPKDHSPDQNQNIENTSPDANESNQVMEKYQDQTYILFPAFGIPPDGHALSGADMITDRFVRGLPLVAGPLNRGEEPPRISIKMLGTPMALAGKVTPQWIDQLKASGLGAYGQLYAPYLEQLDLENQLITFQGASKGALIAEQVANALPDDLKSHARVLMDNPAGGHGQSQARYLKGTEVATGLGAETAGQMLFGETMKSLAKLGGPFLENLKVKTGIESDGKAEVNLKKKAALQEALLLFKGDSPSSQAVRAYVRRAIADPLTFNPLRFVQVIRQRRKYGPQAVFTGHGRPSQNTLEAIHSGTHFFSPYQKYDGWLQRLWYCLGTKEDLIPGQPETKIDESSVAG